jgi:c-di-GMP-binding flagellar brake protein YcgR
MASVIEEDLEEYTSKAPREVAYNLRQLIQAGERISVIFADGHESFLTILLDIDEDTGLLYFDWGGAEDTVRKFLQSDRNFFVCNPSGIRNQFMVGKVWEVQFEKRRAFATRLPQRFMRLQRREFFRLSLPFSLRPQCSLQSTQHPKPLLLSIVDIGIGGAGFEIPQGTLDFSAGEILERSGIVLGTSARIDVEFNVRYTGRLTRGGKETARMGCQFVRLNGHQEHELQRFLTHVQRELKARAL